jgi:hypothetical protein
MEMKQLQNINQAFFQVTIKPCRILLTAELLPWVDRPGNVKNALKYGYSGANLPPIPLKTAGHSG